MSFRNTVSRLRANWQSGITVALVSIPLSVSLAVASQATPTMGIITAIWAGLLAAIFGGSHFNIVGPTGALSGILATYAIVHGAGALPILALMTGVCILIAYALKLEKFLIFIPGSAIHGLTLGVAFIIAFNQMNFALGLTALEKHEHFVDNLIESFTHINQTDITTFVLFIIFLVAMFLLLRFFPRIPGAIILAPVGILLGYLAQHGNLHFATQTLGSRFPEMSAKLFAMPELFFDASLIPTAIAVAVVAILETMLSAKIADGMTKTKHHKRKEMFGLGIANIASGIMGGIPATAALARTSLNIKSGGNHRTSGIVSSVGIALISLLLLSTFTYIPLAVIAAILVFVAIRMVEREHFVRFWAYDKKGFLIAMIVAFVTVYEDPIIGILLGVALALLVFVEKLSHGQFELIINDANHKIIDKITAEHLDGLTTQGETLVYSIKGQLAYINAASHIARFEQKLNGATNIILRLRELSFIDIDGIDAFDEIVALITSQGKNVYVTGANPLIAELLHDSAAYRALERDHRVFKRTSDVLATLGY